MVPATYVCRFVATRTAVFSIQEAHRPEIETRLALPNHKCGLDATAQIAEKDHCFNHGASDPRKTHNDLVEQGIPISLRTVRSLLNLCRKLRQCHRVIVCSVSAYPQRLRRLAQAYQPALGQTLLPQIIFAIPQSSCPNQLGDGPENHRSFYRNRAENASKSMAVPLMDPRFRTRRSRFPEVSAVTALDFSP